MSIICVHACIASTSLVNSLQHSSMLSTRASGIHRSSSGELSVSESLQNEGTLSMYDIVIVADQGQEEAWTVTTVVIGEIESILIPNHPCLYR